MAREVEAAGGVAKEFNTIAVDDGIAMGRDGMLYSLPSRELIADQVEYMVNAHCADAMVVAADESVSDEDVEAIENAACPTCIWRMSTAPGASWRSWAS